MRVRLDTASAAGFAGKTGGSDAALCDDFYRWQHRSATRMMETPTEFVEGAVFVFVGVDAVVLTWNTR
jgi:hypothetical protein